MGICADQFEGFSEAIDFKRESPSLVGRMRASKRAVEKAIKSHLLAEGMVSKPPSLKLQGSYKLNTLVRSAPGDAVDIDFGVHLDLGGSQSDWPTPRTVQNWVSDAIEFGTDVDSYPIKKKRCVRLEYANDYHIDIPIYATEKDWLSNTTCYVATTDGGWIESDPRAFEKWFIVNRHGASDSKLVRDVRALKCWVNHRYGPSKPEPPSGFILTVLAGENVNQHIKDQDDRLASLFSTLADSFGGLFCTLRNPVNADENLLERLSSRQVDQFSEELSHAAELSERALGERREDKASALWSRLFGDRFPK